jgi:electron transfer flavoprotein alpha subunit
MAAKIWIVLQHRDGQLHRMSREAIAAGQRLAALVGGSCEAVVLGSGTAEVAAQVQDLALARISTVEHAALAAYTPGGYVSALAPAIRSAAPDWVFFPHTYQSVDYVPKLAQAAGAASLPEVTGFEQTSDGLVWKRPILGGKLEARVRVRGTGPVLVSVQSGAFPADGAVAGSAPIEALPVDTSAIQADREILGIEAVAGEKLDLTKAGIIVAAGRGVGGADKLGAIQDLAQALGAEIAASRPVIDSGWLDRDRQIGSSGQTVAPRLYIAAGISGAIQHTVGMKGSQVIVAINKDPGAPIFNIASYGIVGDLHEILPAITKAVREAKG